MDITLFEKELEAIHENGIMERNNSSSITDIKESMDKEICCYESFIPDFFYKNGNETNIRHMYAALKEDRFTESTIEAVDLYESRRIYDDYYSGMKKFVTEILALDTGITTESVDSYRDNLDKAKNADAGFLKEIFGGKYNASREMPITEAVKNLEFLIDFIPSMGDMRKASQVMLEGANDGDLTRESVGVLCNSLCRYCYESIKTTINTYGMIDEKINAPLPKNTVPRFQVW